MVIIAQKETSVQLDRIDKKIFYYLNENYRIPRRKLAKLLLISPQLLNHRIQKLERHIIKPYVCIDYPALNIKSFMLIYNTLTEEELKTLYSSEQTYLVIHIIGHKRHVAIIMTEDIIEFCTKNTPNSLPEIYYITQYSPDSWNGFEIKPQLPRKLQKDKKKQTAYTPDKKDYTLLWAICNNPTASFLELYKQTNLSRKTIKIKMKALEDANIIQKYRFAVNIPKTGLLTYFIILTCKPKELSKIYHIVHNNPYAGFIYQSHNKLFFTSIVFTHQQLLDLLLLIEKSSNTQIEVFQNTGEYLINPVPNYVKQVLKERSKFFK